MDPTSLTNEELPTVAPLIGKMAKLRNGSVIGPMIWDDNFGVFRDGPLFLAYKTWHKNGRYFMSRTDAMDIVEVISCPPKEVWIFHSSDGFMHMQDKTEEALRNRHAIYTSEVPGTFSRYVLAESK